MHCTSKALLLGAFGPALRRSSSLPPGFLIPSIATTATSHATFSSTTPSYARKNARKDGNLNRGVSALRRTGIGKRQRLSVTVADLPKPVLNPEQRSTVEVDPDHGLYGFFNEAREALMTPVDLSSHGRGWTIQELRRKEWEDLHRLWWVCVKEMNILKTTQTERKRLGNMYGEHEADEREKEVKKTMKAIKYVLTERWYAWENARVAAMEDPEVNLFADPEQGEEAYLPQSTTTGHELAEGEAGRMQEAQPVEDKNQDAQPMDVHMPSEGTGRGGKEARL